MSETRLKQIERRIARIQDALTRIGSMRPGSLTRQYQNPQTKRGAYWQISYTRNMRSKTEYVRQERLADIRKEIAEYKRFRKLIEEWIDLGIEASKIRIKIDKMTGSV